MADAFAQANGAQISANKYDTFQLPHAKELKTKDLLVSSQYFSRKHYFNYLMYSRPRRTEMIYESSSREQVNKMDQLD